jgi:Bacterial regulatory helix-turn-helix protein, lysR family
MTTPPAKIALRVSQEFSLPTALVLSGRTYAHHRCHGFRGVDLNLLICLRVLLVEQHVTRSAERLGITQPAMSASLARLRTLFRDQLLVRGPKGLVLDATGRTAS